MNRAVGQSQVMLRGIAFALVLAFGGCRPAEDGTRFVTTIPPLRAIVAPVAGEDVGVLVPAGASPHTYEPKPSDARLASQAEVLFYGSDELDGWAAGLDTRLRVALLDLVPDSMRRSAYGLTGTDPHFWMDPLTVQAVLPGLAEMLCERDPGHCDAFRRNARDFAGRLGSVHDSLATLMAPAAGTSIILSHSFLQYFADRYDLRIAGVLEAAAGSEPTPRDMQRLVETARASSVRAIFTLPQHSDRAAEALSEATGVPVVELDPIGSANDIADLLYLNARKIRSALLDSIPQP